MRNTVFVLTVIVLASGCATRPGNIKPAVVESSLYSGQTCITLEAEHSTAKAALADYEAKQTRRANLEIGSVLLFGVFGAIANATISDNEDNVAHWKGKVKAIEDAKKAQNCPVKENLAS